MEYIKQNIKKLSLALTPVTEPDPPPNINQPPRVTTPTSFTTAITPYSPTIYHHRRRRSSGYADAISFSRGPQQTISPEGSDIESGIRQSDFQIRHNRSVSDSNFSEYIEKPKPHPKHQSNNIATVSGASGHINPAFLPSTSNIPDSVDQVDINTHNKVYREQYWTWSCKCQSWTKCEKILLVIIAILFCIVCGLVTVIALFSGEIEDLKDGQGLGPIGGIGGIWNQLF